MTASQPRILEARARAAFAGCVMVVGACNRDKPPAPVRATALPPPQPSARVDRLAPGELVEGTEHAFELKLPVGIHVTNAFASVVYAWGQVDPMEVANFIRAEVSGGAVTVGAAATVFDRVTTAGNPARLLRIRVDSGAQGRVAHLEIQDVTPTPVPAASSTAERWRQVGLTPDGKLLDPSHLR